VQLVLYGAARFHRDVLPDHRLLTLTLSSSEEEREASVLFFFSSPQLRTDSAARRPYPGQMGVNRRYLTDLTIQRFNVSMIQRFYFLFPTSQLLNFFFQLITLQLLSCGAESTEPGPLEFCGRLGDLSLPEGLAAASAKIWDRQAQRAGLSRRGAL
jgi:hypothetical protein